MGVEGTAAPPKPNGSAPAEVQTRSNDGRMGPKHPAQEGQVAPTPKSGGTIDGTKGQLNERANKGQPAKAAEPPKPEEPWKKRLKLKVDGEEMEEEFDEETLVRELQLSRAARKRMSEAAQMRKQAESYAQAWKKGDAEALKAIGVDLDAVAAAHLAAQAKRAMLPKEQVELEDVRGKLQALEAEREQWVAQQREAAQAQQAEAAWKQAEPEFAVELEKAALPKDYATMQFIASVGEEFARAGVDLSPKQVVAEVARRQAARTQRYVVQSLTKAGAQPGTRVANPEAVLGFLRRNNLFDGLREALQAEWEANQGRQPQAPVPEPEGEEKAEPKFVFSDTEWKRSLRGR